MDITNTRLFSSAPGSDQKYPSPSCSMIFSAKEMTFSDLLVKSEENLFISCVKADNGQHRPPQGMNRTPPLMLCAGFTCITGAGSPLTFSIRQKLFNVFPASSGNDPAVPPPLPCASSPAVHGKASVVRQLSLSAPSLPAHGTQGQCLSGQAEFSELVSRIKSHHPSRSLAFINRFRPFRHLISVITISDCSP